MKINYITFKRVCLVNELFNFSKPNPTPIDSKRNGNDRDRGERLSAVKHVRFKSNDGRIVLGVLENEIAQRE